MRDEGSPPPLRLEIGEMLRRAAPAFLNNLCEAIGVAGTAAAGVDLQLSNVAKSLDKPQKASRFDCRNGLPQPGQPAEVRCARAQYQEVLETFNVIVAQVVGQGPKRLALGAQAGLGAEAFTNGNRRHNDAPPAELLEKRRDEHRASARVGRHREEPGCQFPIESRGEGDEAEQLADLGQVASTNLVVLGVRPKGLNVNAAELARNELEHGLRRSLALLKRPARIAEVAEHEPIQAGCGRLAGC